MKMNLVNSLIPPFIGGILIATLALMWEISEDTSQLEACEVYDLSSWHYLGLLIGGTLFGAIIQFTIIEQVFKVVSAQNKFNWFVVGFSLTLLLGTCLMLITRQQSADFQELLENSIPAYFMALVFVAGIIFSSRLIKLRYTKAAY